MSSKKKQTLGHAAFIATESKAGQQESQMKDLWPGAAVGQEDLFGRVLLWYIETAGGVAWSELCLQGAV